MQHHEIQCWSQNEQKYVVSEMIPVVQLVNTYNQKIHTGFTEIITREQK